MEDSINKRVMAYIKDKTITIKSLAAIIKVNEKTLGNKLTGRIRMDLDTLLAILSAFENLSSEWLFRGKGSMELSSAQADVELGEVCIDQAKEIFRLKQRVAELEGEKKDRA